MESNLCYSLFNLTNNITIYYISIININILIMKTALIIFVIYVVCCFIWMLYEMKHAPIMNDEY